MYVWESHIRNRDPTYMKGSKIESEKYSYFFISVQIIYLFILISLLIKVLQMCSYSLIVPPHHPPIGKTFLPY